MGDRAKGDILYLLKPDFLDAAYPHQRFYCEHCALLEGLLSSFPQQMTNLEVRRIAFPRPRAEVIALVGEAHQSLPLLILAEGETSPHQTGTHNGTSFVSGKDHILKALAERYGLPDPHP